jgi:hypothetical protein
MRGCSPVAPVGGASAKLGVGAGSASEGAAAVGAVVAGVGVVGAAALAAGAAWLGVGAGSADESARAAERGDSETKADAPSAIAEIRRTLWVIETSHVLGGATRRVKPFAL